MQILVINFSLTHAKRKIYKNGGIIMNDKIVIKGAKEHNLNASTAKKIVNVAPKIIMNMSADSRTYFDMILDGKFSIEDKHFVNTAIAIMAGHLQTNPDDAKLIADIINDNSTIKENINLHTKNKVPSKLTINDFLKLHNINKENSTK